MFIFLLLIGVVDSATGKVAEVEADGVDNAGRELQLVTSKVAGGSRQNSGKLSRQDGGTQGRWCVLDGEILNHSTLFTSIASL